MGPIVFQLNRFIGGGGIGKPEVPVVGMLGEVFERFSQIVRACAHKICRPAVFGQNKRARRLIADKQMNVPQGKRPREHRSRGKVKGKRAKVKKQGPPTFTFNLFPLTFNF